MLAAKLKYKIDVKRKTTSKDPKNGSQIPSEEIFLTGIPADKNDSGSGGKSVNNNEIVYNYDVQFLVRYREDIKKGMIVIENGCEFEVIRPYSIGFKDITALNCKLIN